MNTESKFLDLMTGAALMLVLASVLLSVTMALADDRVPTPNLTAIYQSTIKKSGCAALGEFQDAVSAATSALSSPGASVGTIQGYVGSLSQALHSARSECNQVSFEDGAYAGRLFANVFCQVAEHSPSALAIIDFQPLYDGWSAGKQVNGQCAVAFNAAAAGCASGGLAAQMLDQVQGAVCD